MLKIILKNIAIMWTVTFSTNLLLILLLTSPDNPNPEMMKFLTFFNSMFWGMHFMSKVMKEIEDKNGQNTKGKDDSGNS